MDTNGRNFESELVSYDTWFSILIFDIRTGSNSPNSLGKKSNQKVKIMYEIADQS